MQERSLLTARARFVLLALQDLDFNKYIASVHKEKEPLQCNLCDANFTQKGYLN